MTKAPTFDVRSSPQQGRFLRLQRSEDEEVDQPLRGVIALEFRDELRPTIAIRKGHMPLHQLMSIPRSLRQKALRLTARGLEDRRCDDPEQVIDVRPPVDPTGVVPGDDMLPFIPCTVEGCPHRGTLWSPVEGRPYCIRCWHEGKNHRAFGIRLAMTSDNGSTEDLVVSTLTVSIAKPKILYRVSRPKKENQECLPRVATVSSNLHDGSSAGDKLHPILHHQRQRPQRRRSFLTDVDGTQNS